MSAAAHSHRHVPVPRTRRLLYLAAVALAPIACVVLFLVNPAAKDDPYPNCPFLWLTGYYCPGCGTLRAYHQVLRGNFDTALGLNPLTVVALPVVVYAIASAWLAGYRGYALPTPRLSRVHGWGITIALVAFGVIRNLRLESLEWMRP